MRASLGPALLKTQDWRKMESRFGHRKAAAQQMNDTQQSFQIQQYSVSGRKRGRGASAARAARTENNNGGVN